MPALDESADGGTGSQAAPLCMRLAKKVDDMDKQKDMPDPKKTGHRDSTKPGTIVAGPEAHAHEGAGQSPAGRGGRPQSEPDDKPAKGH
ncbi:MAG: hypothetical protein J0I23_21925 [Rhizobiales bacterium]|nr:hypothetical protein [Hyphomicrobiales bacterium]